MPLGSARWRLLGGKTKRDEVISRVPHNKKSNLGFLQFQFLYESRWLIFVYVAVCIEIQGFWHFKCILRIVDMHPAS